MRHIVVPSLMWPSICINTQEVQKAYMHQDLKGSSPFTILFYYTALRKSLCTYERCWKWCPWASMIQAWTRWILFTNTFCRSACEMFLMHAVTAVFNSLTHCGPVTQIWVFCVSALQLWKTDDAKLPFNTRLVFTHLITQYMERKKNGPPGRVWKKHDFTLN
jgi:hypothetical protein